MPSLVTLVLALAALAAPAAPAGPAAPRPAPQERRVVAYFHEAAGESRQGTISDLDGAPIATWTVVAGAHRRQASQPLTAERFKAILAGFDLPELQPFEVKRKDQKLDFRSNQVLSLNLVGRNKAMRSARTFLVPAKPASPRIQAWLQLLQIPRGGG